MVLTKGKAKHTTEALQSAAEYEYGGWLKFLVDWGMILTAVFCLVAGLLPFTYNSYYVTRLDVWTMHHIFPVLIPVTRMIGTVLIIAAALMIITCVQLAGFSSIAPKLLNICFVTVVIAAGVYVAVACFLFFTEDALTYEILKADELLKGYVAAFPQAYTGEASVFDYQSVYTAETLQAFLEANQFGSLTEAVALFDKVETGIQLLVDSKGQEVANQIVSAFIQNTVEPGSVEITMPMMNGFSIMQVRDTELVQWNAVKTLQTANFGDAFKLLISSVAVELVAVVVGAVMLIVNRSFMKKHFRLFVK